MQKDELSYSGGVTKTRPNHTTELIECVFNDTFCLD